MGERESHAPGTFSWADLSTTDTAGASRFYAAVLGWKGQEMPAGDAVTYWILRRDEHDVAGMSAMSEEQRAAPAWVSYVTVEDADAAAERVATLGGSSLMPPFDVLDAGRMALVRDPQGTVLAMWEPRAHIGAGLVNEPGAMVMNQLVTGDPEGAARFYTGLFGWRIVRETDEPPYWTIHTATG